VGRGDGQVTQDSINIAMDSRGRLAVCRLEDEVCPLLCLSLFDFDRFVVS
jgi:hypothetical protein